MPPPDLPSTTAVQARLETPISTSAVARAAETDESLRSRWFDSARMGNRAPIPCPPPIGSGRKADFHDFSQKELPQG